MAGIVRTLLLGGLALLTAMACQTQRILQDDASGPFVILKLDDLWYEDGLVHPGWLQVMDFLHKEGVVGTIGIVGNSIEKGNPDYFDWIKERAEEGVEFWNHGYCHCKPVVEEEERREFRGTDIAFQQEQLTKTQRLAKEKLGLTLRSFGAPYNATDEATAKVLDNIPDLKVWMYKETSAPTEKFQLKRIKEVNIEYPVHVPDFQKFKEGYEKNADEELLTIQGHPRSWVKEAERFEAFKQIVLFLKSKKARFITPYKYYLLHNKDNKNS